MTTKNTIKQVDDAKFEINRIKSGRGFRYLDKNGSVIKGQKQLKRLKQLVIPPMWTDVLISQWEDGHVQATGRDAKDRKQYIYHSEWEKQRQQEKFDKMLSFAKQLPSIREQCEAHLSLDGWPKEKVLALVVSVLDSTGIRIGNQRYTNENESYGLTTLRRKHMSEAGDKLLFEYKGKSHQQRTVSIDDDELVAYIQQVAEQPGYEIFRYQESANHWISIDSEDVNQYIHEIAGDEFYSKDFRTWVATRLAVEKYPDAVKEKELSPRKKMTNILLRAVADEIGNTPAVCKDYYVHPSIMQLIDSKSLPVLKETKADKNNVGISAAEKIVLKVLKKAQ